MAHFVIVAIQFNLANLLKLQLFEQLFQPYQYTCYQSRGSYLASTLEKAIISCLFLFQDTKLLSVKNTQSERPLYEELA